MLKRLTAEGFQLFGGSLVPEGQGQILSGHGPTSEEGIVGEISEPTAKPFNGRQGKQTKKASQAQKAFFYDPAGPPNSHGMWNRHPLI